MFSFGYIISAVHCFQPYKLFLKQYIAVGGKEANNEDIKRLQLEEDPVLAVGEENC